jgi:hypothetical protein
MNAKNITKSGWLVILAFIGVFGYGHLTDWQGNTFGILVILMIAMMVIGSAVEQIQKKR